MQAQASEDQGSFFMDKQMKKAKNVIATWSGGKDSCFAAYKAVQMGYHLKLLVNTITSEFKRVGLHGTEDVLIQEQAKAIEIPLFQKAVTGFTYGEEFKKALGSKRYIADGVVFGDIFLDECKNRNEKISKELGFFSLEPLWGRKSIAILTDFIQSGFEAYIVSCQANLLGSEWVGRKIDTSFLADIQKLETIDPCGENGEYHTFVTDGPLFKKKIVITQTAKLLKNGYWFLDIQKYHVSQK